MKTSGPEARAARARPPLQSDLLLVAARESKHQLYVSGTGTGSTGFNLERLGFNFNRSSLFALEPLLDLRAVGKTRLRYVGCSHERPGRSLYYRECEASLVVGDRPGVAVDSGVWIAGVGSERNLLPGHGLAIRKSKHALKSNNGQFSRDSNVVAIELCALAHRDHCCPIAGQDSRVERMRIGLVGARLLAPVDHNQVVAWRYLFELVAPILFGAIFDSEWAAGGTACGNEVYANIGDWRACRVKDPAGDGAIRADDKVGAARAVRFELDIDRVAFGRNGRAKWNRKSNPEP